MNQWVVNFEETHFRSRSFHAVVLILESG